MKMRWGAIEKENYCTEFRVESDELENALTRFVEPPKEQSIFGYGDKCSVTLIDTVGHSRRFVTIDVNGSYLAEDSELDDVEKRLLRIASIYYILTTFELPKEYIQKVLSEY